MRKVQNSLAFDADTKLHSLLADLTFSAKLAINMVTWSFLPFGVNVSLLPSYHLSLLTISNQVPDNSVTACEMLF